MPGKLTRNTAGAAMSGARGLEARDKYIYRVLLDRADNFSADGTTLSIPDRMQPGGQSDLTLFGVSRRNVQRALAHLKLHGWLTSVLKSQGSRGRPPCHYTLLVGTDCDCPDKAPVKRQDDAQLGPNKAPHKAPETHEYSARIKRQTAGQTPFSTKGKEAVAGEGVREPWPDLSRCTVCQGPMDQALARAGLTSHPCCDDDSSPRRTA